MRSSHIGSPTSFSVSPWGSKNNSWRVSLQDFLGSLCDRKFCVTILPMLILHKKSCILISFIHGRTYVWIKCKILDCFWMVINCICVTVLKNHGKYLTPTMPLLTHTNWEWLLMPLIGKNVSCLIGRTERVLFPINIEASLPTYNSA